MPFDAKPMKAVLQNPKVVGKLVVVLGLIETDLARIDDVQYLTVDAAIAKLLDLGNVELPYFTGTFSRLLIQFGISVRGTKYPSSIIPKASLV